MNRKYLVTGATGFIGSAIVRELARAGNTVHCLVRDFKKAESIKGNGIILFRGDILDYSSVRAAAEGCSALFHTAAFTRVSGSDREISDLNITGTETVFRAASDAGIKNAVFTSTAGVFGPSAGGEVNESSQRTHPYFIKYEETKAVAEQRAFSFSESGMRVVVVNPTRVYGPGPLSGSNSVTKMLCGYSEGKWRIIPGNGKSIGNYVWLEDVVRGHILAMEKGKAGERYILGGENADFNTFFRKVAEVSGKKFMMIRIPAGAMIFLASIISGLAHAFSKTPLITPGLAKRYLYNWRLSSEKAEKELGYNHASLYEGIRLTLNWYSAGSSRK
jgi:farnesol dehydrogenase